MKHSPIFLQPVFKERIWGGDTLGHRFGYSLPSSRTGECWAISAHPEGENVVRHGPYAGLTLGQLWSDHRYLFGNAAGERFPLLVKLIDARDNLSVQVHPNDAYAARYAQGQSGKTEAWYMLNARSGAEIVYGHTAKSREEFKEQAQAGNWERLLRRVPAQAGQWFEVPSGMVHALGAGLLIYEVQQNSDLTYRLYDYDRVGANGKPRELHLEQALANVSLLPPAAQQLPRRLEQPGISRAILIENEYFGLQKWSIQDSATLQQQAPYLLVSVIEGQGQINTQSGEFCLRSGDHLLLPTAAARHFSVLGNSEWLVAMPHS